MELIKLVVLHRRTCSGIMCGASTCTISFECFQLTLMEVGDCWSHTHLGGVEPWHVH